MKLLKGVTVSVLLFLLCFVAPFNIHADNIDSHIRGRNYTYEPITYTEFQATTSTKYYQNVGVFHITFELDDEYIGYVLPRYTIEFDNYFYGASSPYWGTLSKTFDRRVFVNGSSFSIDVTVNWNSISVNSAHTGDTPYFYDSYTITNSDVTKYADIDSLDQIVNILSDLYNSNDQVEGLLNDQLTQLQQVVSNTSLANQYLDTISKIRQYNIANESLLPVFSFFRRFELYEPQDGSYISNFPIFKVPQNSVIYTFNTQPTPTYAFIFYANRPIYNKTNFLSNFDVEGINEDTLTVTYLDRMNVSTGTNIGYQYLVKATFKYSSSGLYSITYKQADTLMSPIFINKVDGNYSTDFCLLYGLTNPFLNNINIIANGTTQSNQQSSDLSSGTDSMQQQMDDLIDQEDSYNDQMNNSINAIDFTSPVSQNAGILPAANFVINIFNGLIQNNAFSVLILIVCVLIIGKKVIGK